MRYLIVKSMGGVGVLSVLVLIALGLHLTFDPAPTHALALLYWVALPAAGLLLVCAAVIMALVPDYPSFRADYSHELFGVEAELLPSGPLRRRFDWLVKPRVLVTLRLDMWPCNHCLAALKTDLRQIFGDVAIRLDQEYDIIQFKAIQPARNMPLLNEEFGELSDVVSTRLNKCRIGLHQTLRLVG